MALEGGPVRTRNDGKGLGHENAIHLEKMPTNPIVVYCPENQAS